jgi:stage III sporulation protein AF
VDALNLLVTELVILAILAVFLELLIPAGELSRYVRMVLGLLIIVAVLQAATGFWHRELAGTFGELSLQQTVPASMSILDEGRQRWEENHARALDEYRAGLARQIMALTRLNPDVEVVKVEVELDVQGLGGEVGRLQEITLYILPDRPGTTAPGVGREVDDGRERLRRTVAEFYNVDEAVVKYDIQR